MHVFVHRTRGVWHSTLAIMLKLRRSINQTLQGAPPSCESPRILPLALCVPPEDVPPTRIPRTGRDGAQSVKPLATPIGAAGARRLRCSCVSIANALDGKSATLDP